MKTISTKAVVFASPEIEAVGKAFEEVTASFERFCLAAGIEAQSAMMTKDRRRSLRSTPLPLDLAARLSVGPH